VALLLFVSVPDEVSCECSTESRTFHVFEMKILRLGRGSTSDIQRI
jgi:hypothetical protein